MVSGCLRLDSLGGLAAATEKKEGVSSRGARQREVQRLVSLGYSSKDIGSIMNISPSTVNVVRWKLGLAEPVRTRRRTRSVGRKKTAARP
jgi:FixJ family two-component response regulator